MGIEENYRETARRVAQAAHEAGRDPSEVRLVAVSKTVGLSGVAAAVAGGACDFGENRPDSIVEKQSEFPQARWHFIGNIQSRRIPDIVRSATLVHSLCHERHAAKMDEAAARLGKVQDVLVEVNVSGEQSKDGVAPQDLKALLSALEDCRHLRLRGLMTMAPRGDVAVARACFEELAHLHADVRQWLPDDRAACFDELSMGMSEDWREAVFAGATIVRIGRAIFDDAFGAQARS